jgi:hypothetical protein
MKKYSIENYIISLLLASGLALSLWQFIYNRSLYIDEAMLALNIIRKTSAQLLLPLEYIQVAPILFLQIEKFCSLIIPNSEYGLRLFPLLCFWTSLFCFYKIAVKIFDKKLLIIFALSLFVFNPMFLRYSNEVKQYITDVCVLLAMYCALLKEYKTLRVRLVYLSIAGSIAIFLSNVAPIILLTCGIYLLYEEFFVTKRKRILPYLPMGVLWMSVFAVYYVLFIHNHPLRYIMVGAWQRVNAFLPLNSMTKFCEFVFYQASHFAVGIAGNIPFAIIWVVIFITGFIKLLQTNNFKILILTILPLIIHLILSAMKMYPMSTRLNLFVFPCLIIISGFGFEWLLNKIKIKNNLKILLMVIIPLLLLFNILRMMPLKYEEIKQSIKFVDNNISADEGVYVYCNASRAYSYYQEIGFVKFDNVVIIGNFHRKEREKYLDEVNELTGKIWLIFSHDWDDEEEYIITGIDSIGYKRLKEFHTTDSAAYLYDFSL